MELVFKLALAGLVVALGVIALRPRPLFVIEVSDGRPVVTRGAVSESFLADLADILSAAGVTTARLTGWRAGNRVTLRFSSNLPVGVRQRIRNVWAGAK